MMVHDGPYYLLIPLLGPAQFTKEAGDSFCGFVQPQKAFVEGRTILKGSEHPVNFKEIRCCSIGMMHAFCGNHMASCV